jgi:hypothetical protein
MILRPVPLRREKRNAFLMARPNQVTKALQMDRPRRIRATIFMEYMEFKVMAFRDCKEEILIRTAMHFRNFSIIS